MMAVEKLKGTEADGPSDTGDEVSGAIIEDKYRAFEGKPRSRVETVMSIIFTEMWENLKSKWVLFLLVVNIFSIIVMMLVIYVIVVNPMGGGSEVPDEYPGWVHVFYYLFMTFSVLIFSGYLAAKGVTMDMAEKTYTLYLSRPITRYDYILVKVGTVSMFLTFITIVPNVILYLLIVSSMPAGTPWIYESLWSLTGIFLHGFIIILVFSSLACLSAFLSKRFFWGMAGIYMIVLVSLLMGSLMMALTGNDVLMTLLSIPLNLNNLGAAILVGNDPTLEADLMLGLSSAPWEQSAGIIGGIIAACFAGITWRVRTLEVN